MYALPLACAHAHANRYRLALAHIHTMISRADVVLLLIDAESGPVEQDAKIAGCMC